MANINRLVAKQSLRHGRQYIEEGTEFDASDVDTEHYVTRNMATRKDGAADATAAGSGYATRDMKATSGGPQQARRTPPGGPGPGTLPPSLRPPGMTQAHVVGPVSTQSGLVPPPPPAPPATPTTNP